MMEAMNETMHIASVFDTCDTNSTIASFYLRSVLEFKEGNPGAAHSSASLLSQETKSITPTGRQDDHHNRSSNHGTTKHHGVSGEIACTGLPAFPFRLHEMLNDAETSRFDHIISWQKDGKSFKVHDKVKFEREILSQYFRGQKHYKSFQRQLNIYGFQRIVGGKIEERGAYAHKYLLRGRPRMCRFMVRTKVKNKFSKEPSFSCDMTPMMQQNSGDFALLTRKDNSKHILNLPLSRGVGCHDISCAPGADEEFSCHTNADFPSLFSVGNVHDQKEHSNVLVSETYETASLYRNGLTTCDTNVCGYEDFGFGNKYDTVTESKKGLASDHDQGLQMIDGIYPGLHFRSSCSVSSRSKPVQNQVECTSILSNSLVVGTGSKLQSHTIAPNPLVEFTVAFEESFNQESDVVAPLFPSHMEYFASFYNGIQGGPIDVAAELVNVFLG